MFKGNSIPRFVFVFSLATCVGGFASGCRLGTNNESKLNALKAGILLDEDGNPIVAEPSPSPSAVSDSGSIVVKSAESLGVGNHHACAHLDTGEIQCWGVNSSGQLGDGTTVDRDYPRKVPGIAGTVSKVEVAHDGVCVVLSDKTAQCWGSNANGQLGNNSTTNSSSPVTVMDATGLQALGSIRELGTGLTTYCAILEDTTVRCWGRNNYGQIGDNTTSQRPLPAVVTESNGQGVLSGVTQVVSAFYHVCALMDDTTARCWGRNSYGEIGDNTVGGTKKVPTVVKNATGTAALNGIVELHVSGATSCARMTDGTVNCWGINGSGNLGNGTTTNSALPVQVKNADGSAPLGNVIRFEAATNGVFCARVSSGEVYCWGHNDMGALGNGTYAYGVYPTVVKNASGTAMTDSLQVRVGRYFGCALKTDKSVHCWGSHSVGQLGRDTSHFTETPSTVPSSSGTGALTGVTSYSSGTYHACVVSAGGVYCWGMGSEGNLGNNTSASRPSPTGVEGLSTGVSQVAVGNLSSCALKADGTVWCWGLNSSGQLGVNSTVDSLVPVQVKNVAGTGTLSGITTLVRNYTSYCAMSGAGEAFCWGVGTSGQLGNGLSTKYLPVQVKHSSGTGFLSGATQMAGGANHTCVLIGGGVQCWGNNANGQLGNNGSGVSSLPVAALGLESGVVSIAGSYNYACALKTDNTVWCWGLNSNGMVGDGTTSAARIPVQVTGISGTPVSVHVTLATTCVKISGGGFQCWGSNVYGQMAGAATAGGNQYAPLSVPALASAGITDLFMNGSHEMCGQAASGSLKCWGQTGYLKIPGQDDISLVPQATDGWER